MGEVLNNMDVGFIVDPVPNKPQQLIDEEEGIVQSRGKELSKTSLILKHSFIGG